MQEGSDGVGRALQKVVSAGGGLLRQPSCLAMARTSPRSQSGAQLEEPGHEAHSSRPPWGLCQMVIVGGG